jgi:rod shape-determining protein MreC
MNRAAKANRRIWMTVIIGAVVVLAGLLGVLGPLRWTFNHTVVPAGGGLAALGTSAAEALQNLGQVRNLASDNAQLEEQNAELRQRLAEDAEIRRDNGLLRKQLGLDVAGAPQEVAAEVIAFQPDSYRQFVTINKGSRAGIKTGMAVLSQGVVMGTIADVQPNTARVMLVTDPEFSLTAKDQDTGATGIVRGQLGSGLVMDDVAQSDTMKAGDTVSTSGLGGVVPAGLLIGQLESVNTRANAVFQSGDVQTSLKVNSLRFAFVVVGS